MNIKTIRDVSIALSMVILISSFCTDTFAYKTDKDRKWDTNVVNMYINPSGGPSGSYDAIKNAAQTWTDVSTSSFIFYTAETSSSGSFWGKYDGINLISFAKYSGSIAKTKLNYSVTKKYITEADIYFNTNIIVKGKSYQWGTDGSVDKFDVQNVATHELGHVLCLLDLYGSSDKEKTMYGYGGADVGVTKRRSLEQDDIDGITYLYP